MKTLILSAAVLVLAAAGAFEAPPASDVFGSAEYVQSSTAGASAGPSFDLNEADSELLQSFQQDVAAKFSSDTKAKVAGAKRASLRCTALAANEALETVQLEWQGTPIIIHKTAYQYFPELNGRRVFMGDLEGTDSAGMPLTGSATVTWNDACDPDIFHLSVVLNSMDGETHALKSMPCSSVANGRVRHNAGIPNCSWLASVKTQDRDELEHTQHRALLNNTTAQRPARSLADDGSTLNVIWFYTPAAQQVWGDAKVKSIIAAGVVTANQALLQSRTFLKLKCVGIFPLQGYNVNSHTQTLADLNAGIVPGVRNKRNLYKADVVQVVIEDSSYCGYGGVMTSPSASFSEYAYSTVYTQCFSTYSHIHEIGHNLGCLHNKENGGPSYYWPFSYGHRYCDAPGSFRSIMSYSCPGSTRVPYFSNPDVYYQGKATGTAGANNARVIRQSKGTATNFRQGG